MDFALLEIRIESRTVTITNAVVLGHTDCPPISPATAQIKQYPRSVGLPCDLTVGGKPLKRTIR